MIFLLFPVFLSAQQLQFAEIEEQLQELGTTLLEDTLKVNRISAAGKIEVILKETLTQQGAFEYPFASLTFLSIQQPEDGSFRIFTWQLYEDIKEYKYFGIIQMPGKTPTIHLLTDESSGVADEDLVYEVMDKERWYGALYYNLKEYKTKKGKRYLLFGFDGYGFFNKRKLIEVLSFDKGAPVFGEPTFYPNEENRPDLALYRMVLTFSSATSIRLNYDEYLGLIVYDNLLTSNNELGEDAYLPDGSYRGYKLKKGRWIVEEKIFDHTWEDAPRPQPILNGRKGNKDVFGNR